MKWQLTRKNPREISSAENHSSADQKHPNPKDIKQKEQSNCYPFSVDMSRKEIKENGAGNDMDCRLGRATLMDDAL